MKLKLSRYTIMWACVFVNQLHQRSLRIYESCKDNAQCENIFHAYRSSIRSNTINKTLKEPIYQCSWHLNGMTCYCEISTQLNRMTSGLKLAFKNNLFFFLMGFFGLSYKRQLLVLKLKITNLAGIEPSTISLIRRCALVVQSWWLDDQQASGKRISVSKGR